MNRSLLLHVVERLEGLVAKLPATIQKPILNELTPLKELFLQQRPPRFLFVGSDKASLSQVVGTLFPGFAATPSHDHATPDRLWQEFHFTDRGTISVLDAREADRSTRADIEEQLKNGPADIAFFISDDDRRKLRKGLIDDAAAALAWNDRSRPKTRLVGVVLLPPQSSRARGHDLTETAEMESRLEEALGSGLKDNDRVLQVLTAGTAPELERHLQAMMSMIARQLPNEAQIEIARISGDKEAQAEIAHLLVKSTTAVCTAIGAQPIPMADLPILTTLQLVMVSGIMYPSGRERTLRAATEFVAALGANVGAGMLLREGTRALLKFLPGWGNVVSGMVAGAGTYAIGRAATAYFVEGVSLKDARRTYLSSRKKAPRPTLAGGKQHKKERGKLLRGRSKTLRLRR